MYATLIVQVISEFISIMLRYDIISNENIADITLCDAFLFKILLIILTGKFFMKKSELFCMFHLSDKITDLNLCHPVEQRCTTHA